MDGTRTSNEIDKRLGEACGFPETTRRMTFRFEVGCCPVVEVESFLLEGQIDELEGTIRKYRLVPIEEETADG
jgi:hypothetical protein